MVFKYIDGGKLLLGLLAKIKCDGGNFSKKIKLKKNTLRISFSQLQGLNLFSPLREIIFEIILKCPKWLMIYVGPVSYCTRIIFNVLPKLYIEVHL